MMSILVTVGVLWAVTYAEDSGFDQMIDLVNNADLGWQAGHNFPPGTTESFIRRMCGGRLEEERKSMKSQTAFQTKTYSGETKIPEEFDARKQWPNCPTIPRVLDQGQCGSCWAFGTTSSFSDRLCIATNGNFTLPLSEGDVVTCNLFGLFLDGCDGGFIWAAWWYLAMWGVVTGGGYDSKVGCRTYPFQPCQHWDTNGTRVRCDDGTFKPTPLCMYECNNPEYKHSYFHDKHKYQADMFSLGWLHGVEAVQEDIIKHGPVSTGFIVYSDFAHYKSGVYRKHPNATFIGGHVVRVIGWGAENGTPYWLVVNSWNTDWGDKGLFKIRRGSNECGIEDHMYSGLPAQSALSPD